MNTNTPAPAAQQRDTLASLCEELNAWYDTQGLPHLCAFEMLHEDISPAQFAWLQAFNVRWEAAAGT